MAIMKRKDVLVGALVGKYICAPSILHDQEHGSPAQIKSVTAAQITYIKLPRGNWNEHEKEWEVSPSSNQDDEKAPNKCKMSSIAFVCDTAEEAIALYAAAVATRKRIQQFRDEQLQLVALQALQGTLPIPPYLCK